jgi:NTE family protein
LFATRFETDKNPGLFVTISNTINIFQDQITCGRLDADPAEVLIAPKVCDIGMLDFQRAGDAIEEGNSCVQDVLPKIRELMDEPR